MIKEGDDVRLIDVPRKKIVNADVIRSGDYVFIKYTKPQYGVPDFSVCRIYETEKWAFPLSIKSWPWQKQFMAVLVRLGLMSKEREAELVESDRQRTEREQRKWDSERLSEIATRWGLKDVAKAASTLEPPKGSDNGQG